MSNVIYLQEPPRIAHYLRVGHREHVLADRMRAEGRIALTGIIFDGCSVEAQRSTLADFRADRHQLILDTNVAEQSVKGLYAKSYSDAPWASKDAPLSWEEFRPGGNRYVIEPISRFAISNGFHSILSPTHYLGDIEMKWFETDLKSCERLRVALDREGGHSVDINYPLILDNAQIKSPQFVKKAVLALADMPISALWLRVAGFGRDATGAGIDKMARAVLGFHDLNIPIVMDRVGGLPAHALASLGIASGYANGLKGRDYFRTYGWLKPISSGGGGGNERHIFVSGLDRRIKVSEMRRVFESSTTARSVYGCLNPECCASIDVMLREPEAHHLGEQSRILTNLSAVPEGQRAEHFLVRHLEGKRRTAARAQRLKKVPEEFRKNAENASIRLNRMKDSLEQTVKRIGKIPFAPQAKFPTNISNGAHIAQRRL